jgi:mannose/fructose-specific phosphotransferase system component IIA
MTVPVVLVGHGGLPAGVLDAVELILGPQRGVAAISLPPDGTGERLAEEVTAALHRIGSAEGSGLVLADLFGGSPANAVAALAHANPALHLVGGLNLGMVLEVLVNPADDAATLAEVAVRAGQDAVIDIAARLRA